MSQRQFKITITKMLSEVRGKMQSENFNKGIDNIKAPKKKIMELRNTRAELKNLLEGFNIKLYQTEERSS